MDYNEYAVPALAIIAAVVGWMIREVLALKTKLAGTGRDHDDVDSLNRWRVGHDATYKERLETHNLFVAQVLEHGRRLRNIEDGLSELKEELRIMNKRCMTHLTRVSSNYDVQEEQ